MGCFGTMYDRESVVRETVQRIVEFPDRRGMAIGVIWRGNDVDGFYTSHMTHGTGRHTEYGVAGQTDGTHLRHANSGRLHDPGATRSTASGWFATTWPFYRQLRIDPQEYAATLARQKFESWGRGRRDLLKTAAFSGQYPPETEPDLDLGAHNESEDPGASLVAPHLQQANVWQDP